MSSSPYRGRHYAGRHRVSARRARLPRAFSSSFVLPTVAAAAARAKAEREGKRWVRPIRLWNITSGYGWRWGKTHDGIDLGAPTGTPLYAMSKGIVIGSFFDPSFGNKIEILYWDGSVSWYGHLSQRNVSKGEAVMPGDLVGLVVASGCVWAAACCRLPRETRRMPGADRVSLPRRRGRRTMSRGRPMPR